MKSRIFTLLNIKPSEGGLVKQLFLVQFFLGVGTSFLFTSALTLFLATYPIKELPKVSLLAAGLLLVANFVYARLEAKLSAKKLLQLIILFSLGSIVFTWLEATIFSISWLPFFLSAWNLVVYMVVSYAFWGMTAIIFNVRESRRLFSVVGSGDIPAKIIGYAAVAILAPVIGVINVLALSIVAFLLGYYFLRQFQHPSIVAVPEHSHSSHGPGHAAGNHPPIIERLFQNNLIFVIAIWSFLGFTIYTLIDLTFVTEIKVRFKSSQELAFFLGVFFAIGRVLAIFLKLIFSSRVINRLGLANSLLITPAVLLLITGTVLLVDKSLNTGLMVFGVMVLFSEVLKSAVQEPAFFILFQPLHPHSRLKGHLITKGYTLPFALVAVSIFAFIFRDQKGDISISLVCGTLVILLAAWSLLVSLIKKEYLHTLIRALKKGYFTGTQLFLNDQPVRELLLAKTESPKPKEVLFALELLEKSGYTKFNDLLLRELNSPFALVKKFVLARIIHRNITEALPLVQQKVSASSDPELKPDLITALYYLNSDHAGEQTNFQNLDPISKKAALLGLAARTELKVISLVEQEVAFLTTSPGEEDKLIALEIMADAPHGEFYASLKTLLQEPAPAIYKKAIETVGKVRAFPLWRAATKVAIQKKATNSLQKSMLFFGDAIFAPEYTNNPDLPNEVILAHIKSAGNCNGKFSTAYLMNCLAPENEWKDAALAALFHKKVNVAGSVGEKEVVLWLENKLEQGKRKVSSYPTLAASASATLLAAAVKSEIEQDLQLILKAFALLYDRQGLERVLQLVKNAGNDTRIYNAIEMLELRVPKRYFLQVDSILEFLLDSGVAQPEISRNANLELTSLIKEIISAPAGDYTIWTKSVALYLIPTLADKSLYKILAEPQVEENSPLFSETKNFVLSQVDF
ncbi:hypothetical protein AHMF7605_05820 [Adhaeribacter arboris]|uniref:ADP,ATP carrier protein n=1 Tax=Adhaeribacter arboris TaxID=2072846 RepID=A0A2T2YC41_9BACT|nr:MFS transporter [Adhaeribacter arboris]PSR53077.1 hypothetical protein AHMF7605_05820 [Adhaeribacter arboris]